MGESERERESVRERKRETERESDVIDHTPPESQGDPADLLCELRAVHCPVS